jgi:hypothetical protein
MADATQTPTFYVATDAIPEYGIRPGYMITIDGGLATVAFDMNAEHFTPDVLAKLREVHAE